MFFQSDCVNRSIKGVVATDFDGTLLQSDHTVSERSRITLEMLGERDVLRVIATGRSYFSLRKVLKENLPVDYLIVASGAGIYCRKSKKLIYRTTLSPEDTEHIGSSLIKMGCDFMVHYPLPENHKFLFYKKSFSNKDYEARFEIYRDYGKPLSGFSELKEGSSQFLVVDHPGSQKYRSLVSQLSGYTVIRTTSPIDNESSWIEIFPKETDKGKTLKYLARGYGLDAGDVLTIGNDFNDIHMLRWASESRVVANAHGDLRSEFKTVSSNDNEGFSEAVDGWIRSRNF